LKIYRDESAARCGVSMRGILIWPDCGREATQERTKIFHLKKYYFML